MNNIYELTPNNGRKSFYGKAKIIFANGLKYLKSYDTICCSIDRANNVRRLSDWKTKTTCSHLKAFLGDELYKGYWNLPLVENREEICVKF